MNELASARPDDTQHTHNVQGAFRVPTEHEADIAGRRLILGNDVLTSGAAADVCARALFRPVLPMSTCWYSRGLWRWRALPYKRCPQAQNAMPPVEIYTTRYCLFCYAAKALLKRKGVNYKWKHDCAQIFIGTVAGDEASA
jgi:glutaredoxin